MDHLESHVAAGLQVDAVQGDQIGRIFAYWEIVIFGLFLENYRNRQKFGLLFSAVKVMQKY
jgi:hypothetical protein